MITLQENIFWIICVIVVVFSIVYFYRRKKPKEKILGVELIGLAPILALLFLFSGMNKRK